MDEFEPLTSALEGLLEAKLLDLPEPLRTRVRDEFSPFVWNDLTPSQRRSVAIQCDQQNDPAREDERQKAWALATHRSETKRQIEVWKAVAAPTAHDLDLKQTKLSELERQLARLDSQMMEVESPSPRATTRESDHQRAAGGHKHTAYPAALAQLRARLNATPDELAAWIFLGPNAGGLAAYLNANELDPAPEFHFPEAQDGGLGDGFAYMPALMACWFRVPDIEAFEPTDRYVTGSELVARWAQVPGIEARAYIRAKIRESRLVDLHPIFGGTQAGSPDDQDLPPLELGLYSVADISRIESEDFGSTRISAAGPESSEARKERLRQRRQTLVASGDKAFLKTIAEEEKLSISRVKQLLSDKKKTEAKPNDPTTWMAPVLRRDRG